MNKKDYAAKTFVGIILITLITFLIINSSSLCSMIAGNKVNIGADRAPVKANEQVKALNNAMVAVSEAVVPTVVSISVVMESKTSPNQMQDQFREFFKFFGQQPNNGDQGDQDESRKSEASGSGVIVTNDGYIVTNNHVIENATEINVTTNDHHQYTAKLIGADPITDLAVLKIDATNLPVAHLADINDVKVGEMVFAVGNPLGLNSTITSGIISQVGRGMLNLPRKNDGYGVEYFIQTDAAINPGNSGGGLYNINGSLVGINTAIATQTGTYIGYGFAIPIDLVKSVVTNLIENGKIVRGYIGVKISPVTQAIAKYNHLDKVEGAVVNSVLDDSPAKKAGIEDGDIIIAVDGKSVSSSNELQSIVSMKKPTEQVKITLIRDGNRIEKNVTLQPRNGEEVASDNSDELEQKGPDQTSSKSKIDFDKLGFTAEKITDAQKKEFDVESGVYISKVKSYSVAYQSRIFQGGVITKADKQSINSPGELQKIINKKKPGDVVLLQIKYKDNQVISAIEIPDKK